MRPRLVDLAETGLVDQTADGIAPGQIGLEHPWLCSVLSFQVASENRRSPAFGARSDLPAAIAPSSPMNESHCSVATFGSLTIALNRIPALSTRS